MEELLGKLMGKGCPGKPVHVVGPIVSIMNASRRKKMPIGSRIAEIEDALQFMMDADEEVVKSFNGKEKLQVAIDDVERWLHLIKKVDTATTIEELQALVEAHWDSQMIHTIASPDMTRTAKYVRKAFMLSWMTAAFNLAQKQAAQARREAKNAASDATSATAADPADEGTDDKDSSDEEDLD